jgi:hypothetical protein
MSKVVKRVPKKKMIREERTDEEEVTLKKFESLKNTSFENNRINYLRAQLIDSLNTYAGTFGEYTKNSIASLFSKQEGTRYLNVTLLVAAIFLYQTCLSIRDTLTVKQIFSKQNLERVYEKLLAQKQKKEKYRGVRELNPEDIEKYNNDLIRYFFFVHNVYASQPNATICEIRDE